MNYLITQYIRSPSFLIVSFLTILAIPFKGMTYWTESFLDWGVKEGSFFSVKVYLHNLIQYQTKRKHFLHLQVTLKAVEQTTKFMQLLKQVRGRNVVFCPQNRNTVYKPSLFHSCIQHFVIPLEIHNATIHNEHVHDANKYTTYQLLKWLWGFLLFFNDHIVLIPW